MENYKIYFDLDSKIAWNRHRMRELYDMYKKIENYYPLFFAYLGFIGIYYFEFILLIINKFDFFLITTLLTTIGLIWSLYYIVRIIFTKEWCQDFNPKEVYIDLFDKKTKALKEIEPDCELKDIELEVRENYNSRLEKNIDENYNTYSIKKNYLNNALKIMLFTLIIYFFNIIHFKQYEIMAKTKDDNERKVTNEFYIPCNKEGNFKSFKDSILSSSESTSQDLFTTEQVELIKQIVREEYKKIIEEEKLEQRTKGLEKIKKNISDKPNK